MMINIDDLHITIKGSTPSQKNRKIISMNRATHRPFLRTAPPVKKWQESAANQIRAKIGDFTVKDYPISINIVFYYDSNRRHDLDNALSSIMDALVASGLIEDDSCKYVSCITVQYGGYDKENARAEIYFNQ
jgi:Holliday junction resolvase RusA-like endonuclease